MNNDVSQAKKIKPVIHLPWYKTQYWSGFIFGLEVGPKRATADTLSRLADIFGVSTDYLLGRTDVR